MLRRGVLALASVVVVSAECLDGDEACRVHLAEDEESALLSIRSSVAAGSPAVLLEEHIQRAQSRAAFLQMIHESAMKTTGGMGEACGTFYDYYARRYKNMGKCDGTLECNREPKCKECPRSCGKAKKPQCKKNSECKKQTCLKNGKCGQCKKDSNCKTSQVCLNGKCRKPKCQKNRDCKLPELCLKNRGSNTGSCGIKKCNSPSDCKRGLTCQCKFQPCICTTPYGGAALLQLNEENSTEVDEVDEVDEVETVESEAVETEDDESEDGETEVDEVEAVGSEVVKTKDDELEDGETEGDEIDGGKTDEVSEGDCCYKMFPDQPESCQACRTRDSYCNTKQLCEETCDGKWLTDC